MILIRTKIFALDNTTHVRLQLRDSWHRVYVSFGARVRVRGPTRNPTLDVAGFPNRFCISLDYPRFGLALQPLATFAAL